MGHPCTNGHILVILSVHNLSFKCKIYMNYNVYIFNFYWIHLLLTAAVIPFLVKKNSYKINVKLFDLKLSLNLM